MEDVLEIIGAIVLFLVIIAVLLVICPWIFYWLSYFGGWLASLTIGGALCSTLNELFRTDFFKPDFIPEFAGLLGWIGSFFKGVSTTTKKIKED